jgi:hypothetical protein
MNVLEFLSPLGDTPIMFAPKDSDSVRITLTSPAGRAVNLPVAGSTDPAHDTFGERWYVQCPTWDIAGRWTLLFDQDGEDTTYYIDVYVPAPKPVKEG